jgi:hypothetical protein
MSVAQHHAGGGGKARRPRRFYQRAGSRAHGACRYTPEARTSDIARGLRCARVSVAVRTRGEVRPSAKATGGRAWLRLQRAIPAAEQATCLAEAYGTGLRARVRTRAVAWVEDSSGRPRRVLGLWVPQGVSPGRPSRGRCALHTRGPSRSAREKPSAAAGSRLSRALAWGLGTEGALPRPVRLGAAPVRGGDGRPRRLRCRAGGRPGVAATSHVHPRVAARRGRRAEQASASRPCSPPRHRVGRSRPAPHPRAATPATC